MAKTKDYRLGEFTYPRGWFMIAEDKELDTHKPLAVRFFGQDFALYRGMATGKVVLLDAYCPHMQTHLGAHNTTSVASFTASSGSLNAASTMPRASASARVSSLRA